MTKYFGTDGIRGKANEMLTPELAVCLGKAAALLTREQGKPCVLIGKDTRVSGDMLESALAAGFMAAGVDVLLLGVIPTPGVAALCRVYDAPGAVISASHNPYYDNGIKFFTAQGAKLPDEAQEQIEELLDNPESIVTQFTHMGRLTIVPGAAQQYMDILLDAQNPRLCGMKLAIDCANGAAAPIAAGLLRRLGAEVIELAGQPDGYNINVNCGSTHPQQLQRAVKEQGAALGLAFDGDADRLIAVDEHGNIVDGDMILTLISSHMRNKGTLSNDCVVITQMCNMALRLKMREQGVNLIESKVGDRYVLEKMRQYEACLGDEQSGHLILSEYNSTGDALVASLYLLSMLAENGGSLGSLTAALHPFAQSHINVPVKNKEGFATDAEISAVITAAEQELAGQGRVLVRASGTEPLLRVMTEGADEAQLLRLSQDIAGVISRRLND